jgi:hypothetical protein
MEAAERRKPLQASERPIRVTGSEKETDCGVPGSIDPGEAKSTPGEQNGETPSALSCSAQYRANIKETTTASEVKSAEVKID